MQWRSETHAVTVHVRAVIRARAIHATLTILPPIVTAVKRECVYSDVISRSNRIQLAAMHVISEHSDVHFWRAQKLKKYSTDEDEGKTLEMPCMYMRCIVS